MKRVSHPKLVALVNNNLKQSASMKTPIKTEKLPSSYSTHFSTRFLLILIHYSVFCVFHLVSTTQSSWKRLANEAGMEASCLITKAKDKQSEIFAQATNEP